MPLGWFTRRNVKIWPQQFLDLNQLLMLDLIFLI